MSEFLFLKEGFFRKTGSALGRNGFFLAGFMRCSAVK